MIDTPCLSNLVMARNRLFSCRRSPDPTTGVEMQLWAVDATHNHNHPGMASVTGKHVSSLGQDTVTQEALGAGGTRDCSLVRPDTTLRRRRHTLARRLHSRTSHSCTNTDPRVWRPPTHCARAHGRQPNTNSAPHPHLESRQPHTRRVEHDALLFCSQPASGIGAAHSTLCVWTQAASTTVSWFNP